MILRNLPCGTLARHTLCQHTSAKSNYYSFYGIIKQVPRALVVATIYHICQDSNKPHSLTKPLAQLFIIRLLRNPIFSDPALVTSKHVRHSGSGPGFFGKTLWRLYILPFLDGALARSEPPPFCGPQLCCLFLKFNRERLREFGARSPEQKERERERERERGRWASGVLVRNAVLRGS